MRRDVRRESIYRHTRCQVWVSDSPAEAEADWRIIAGIMIRVARTATCDRNGSLAEDERHVANHHATTQLPLELGLSSTWISVSSMLETGSEGPKKSRVRSESIVISDQ